MAALVARDEAHAFHERGAEVMPQPLDYGIDDDDDQDCDIRRHVSLAQVTVQASQVCRAEDFRDGRIGEAMNGGICVE